MIAAGHGRSVLAAACLALSQFLATVGLFDEIPVPWSVPLVAKDTQLPRPEAALPRCMRRVMVVPCGLFDTFGNLAAWHTRAKGYSAQAVKADVCRCAEIEKETHLVDHRQHSSCHRRRIGKPEKKFVQ